MGSSSQASNPLLQQRGGEQNWQLYRTDSSTGSCVDRGS
ncbi:hypothetical protein LINPERHAP1_LOCUS6506 [Linum perenne]